MSEPRIKNFEPGLAMPDLPVRDVLPEIARELATNRPVVLQAPPGRSGMANPGSKFLMRGSDMQKEMFWKLFCCQIL